MKIIATTRTKNEASNIDRFCQAYAWADAVLVADGGSEDDTVRRARQYPNVQVRHFTEKVWRGNVWRNPHGRHMNFVFDWALDEGADWIIFDDCDCVPTKTLQDNLRDILEDTNDVAVFLYRLYIWGCIEYFPDMNKPGQSFYAWHRDLSIRGGDEDWRHRIKGIPDTGLLLDHPYSCLHYFFPDEETEQRKAAFYRVVYDGRERPHPLKTNGKLELLPEWAVWR